MFKIGTLADWFGKGLLGGIRESEKCGAEGVQVYAWNELDPRVATEAYIQEVRDTAKECHQQIVALCGELGGYGLEKEEDNADKIDYLKKVILLGKQLDCDIVTTHIGVVPADKSVPRYEVMKKACKELGDFAAEHGSYIAVETGPELIATLRAFIDDCGSKGLAVNYDPANIVMATGDDEAKGVLTAGEKIVHTHAKDGRCLKRIMSAEEYYHKFAEGGLEWSRESHICEQTPLGEGDVHWPEYLAALKQIGYNGFLTIEIEVENSSKEIRMAVDFLKDQIAKMQ